MNVVRSLERGLERLLEGVAGRVFSGRLHPSEIATKLAREADFARFDHETGPATANVYKLVVNRRDLNTDPSDLEVTLTAEIDRYAAEEGLRLEGPCRVSISASDDVPPGTVACHVEVAPGPQVVWGLLVGEGETLEIGRNRAIVGRAESNDVAVPHDDVSRHHALIWRQAGSFWINDLGSANGTTVDGRPVGAEPREFGPSSIIGLSTHSYRFVES